MGPEIQKIKKELDFMGAVILKSINDQLRKVLEWRRRSSKD